MKKLIVVMAMVMATNAHGSDLGNAASGFDAFLKGFTSGSPNPYRGSPRSDRNHEEIMEELRQQRYELEQQRYAIERQRREMEYQQNQDDFNRIWGKK